MRTTPDHPTQLEDWVSVLPERIGIEYCEERDDASGTTIAGATINYGGHRLVDTAGKGVKKRYRRITTESQAKRKR